jgi:1,4-dihydroxy-2-naphthoate octaprenyltransferase
VISRAPAPKLEPGSLRAWVLAVRPATLSAAVVPVVVGTACAHAAGGMRLGPAVAALAGALALQITANLANDVFDHEKGADTSERLGPTRAVQSGLLGARAVRLAVALALAFALAVGVYLTAVAGPAVVAIGLSAMVAAVAYTAGPYPLGYQGLGDLFVMVFFGFIAVCGTAYVQLLRVPILAWYCSIPVGSLSTAILVVNNLRDMQTDAKAGKRTLAVRLGRRATIGEYALLVGIAPAVPAVLVSRGELGAWALLPVSTLPFAVLLTLRVAREQGRALNRALVHTAQLLLAFGLLLAAGLVLATTPPAAAHSSSEANRTPLAHLGPGLPEGPRLPDRQWLLRSGADSAMTTAARLPWLLARPADRRRALGTSGGSAPVHPRTAA